MGEWNYDWWRLTDDTVHASEILRLQQFRLTVNILLLMAEILHHLGGKNPTNNGRSYLSTGAGFQPSTVPFYLQSGFFVTIPKCCSSTVLLDAWNLNNHLQQRLDVCFMSRMNKPPSSNLQKIWGQDTWLTGRWLIVCSHYQLVGWSFDTVAPLKDTFPLNDTFPAQWQGNGKSMPIGSMYGIFTYMLLICMVNVDNFLLKWYVWTAMFV